MTFSKEVCWKQNRTSEGTLFAFPHSVYIISVPRSTALLSKTVCVCVCVNENHASSSVGFGTSLWQHSETIRPDKM